MLSQVRDPPETSSHAKMFMKKSNFIIWNLHVSINEITLLAVFQLVPAIRERAFS